MLKSLYIQNFVLIDSLELEFKAGFTAITGETGAGKSIILDALQVVLGGRGNAKLLKNNAKPASIFAVFGIEKLPALIGLLQDKSIDNENNQLLLRRTIQSDGTSKCYINDVAVGVKLLQEVAQYVFEISNQHESTQLLDVRSHLKLLDEFGNYKENLVELSFTFSMLAKYQKEYDELQQKRGKAEVEIEYLKHSIQELEELDIKEGEEEILMEQRKLALESNKIKGAIESTINVFEQGNILEQLYSIQKQLGNYENVFKTTLGLLNSATIELEEVYKSTFSYQSKFAGAMNLHEIEERLFRVRSVCKKYMVESKALGGLITAKKKELETYEGIEQLLSDIGKQLNKFKQNYLEQASKISEKRKLVAFDLSKLILEHLTDLKMEKADFMVEVVSSLSAEEFKQSGIDKVKFLIKTNDKDFDLIHKIASGGELSRIMLALKISLSKSNLIPTIIFDEIDSGISGAVAYAVGRKLAELGKSYQVIVISHQPQVAALSSNHIVIEKLTAENITVRALELDEKQKLNEIARMISGQSITKESLAAAHRLIEAAA